MKKIRATAVLCTLLFAVAVFGFQYPSAQPNSGQMGTSPSQPTTTPPSQQQTPSTPSQQGQQPGQGQMPNIDSQVKTLSDQLNLTSDQQTKLRSILVDQHEQAMGLVKDNTLSREDKMAKIHSLREGTIAKVKQMLTDDQKPKFDQLIQQQDERIHQREPGSSSNTPPGSSSPSSTPPSGTSPSTTPPASNPPSNTPPSNPPSSKPPL